MGQHFDTLVDIIKSHVRDNESAPLIPNVREYFKSLVKRFALFEFPFDPKDIFPNSGKDKEEYDRYMMDYFQLSEKYNQFLIMPFKFTAIEDPLSVVFLDQIGYGNYRVTLSRLSPELGGKLKGPLCADVVCGDVEVDISGKVGRPFVFDVKPLYHVPVSNGKRNNGSFFSMNNPLEFKCAVLDIQTATMAFIEENVYIMDPANFIVEKRHRECEIEKERRERKKNGKTGREFLHKTIIRPHYTCMSEDAIKEFFSVESGEAKPPKAVRAHWRTLMSERFVNKRWQVIPIAQYYKGQGEIKTDGGWTYQIFLKESPIKIRPYKRE